MPKYSVSKKREDTYHYQSIFDITNPITNIFKKKNSQLSSNISKTYQIN